MKISPCTKGIATGFGVSIGVIGLFMSANLGAYNARKSYLINESIKGRGIEAAASIEDKEEPAYKTTLDKITDFCFEDCFVDLGPRLAEKRFKAGKFDEIIEKYKSEQD